MINLRYHIVSIVAVFLALGIGVLMGSTIVDRALVDNLEGQLDRLQRDLEETDAANRAMDSELDRVRALQETFAAEGTGQLFQGRLEDVPVLVLGVDGMDEEPVEELRRALDAAGAQVAPTLWFTEKLRLTRPADSADLAALLGAPRPEAAPLRAQLAARLALLLLQAGVGDRPPATPARGSTATTTTTIGPTTTATADTADSPDTSGTAASSDGVATDDAADAPPSSETPPSSDGTTGEPTQPSGPTQPSEPDADAARAAADLVALLEELREQGFVSHSGRLGLDDLTGARVVLASGPGSVLPGRDLAGPLLLALAADGVAPAVAAEVRWPDDGPDAARAERDGLVAAIRADDLLQGRVATVDALDTFAGRAAVVLALDDLGQGRVGQYGLGEGAQRLLPPPVP